MAFTYEAFCGLALIPPDGMAANVDNVIAVQLNAVHIFNPMGREHYSVLLRDIRLPRQFKSRLPAMLKT
jgi:hypothetical protein